MAVNPFGSAIGQINTLDGYSRAKELYERQMYEKQQEQYYRDHLNQAAELQRQEAQKQAANQSKTQKRRKAILLLLGA